MKRLSKNFVWVLLLLTPVAWLLLSWVFMWPPVCRQKLANTFPCYSTLRQVHDAKMQWVQTTGATLGAPVDEEAVAKFMRGGRGWGVCPDGGKISFNLVGTAPTCSLDGVPRNKTRIGWFQYSFKPRTKYHRIDEHLRQSEKILPVLWASEDPLATCAQLAQLIIKCKTEVDGKEVNFRIEDMWKGVFDANRLRPTRPEGILCTWFSDPQHTPVAGRDAVYFFFPKDAKSPSPNTFGIGDYYISFLWTNAVVDGQVIGSKTAYTVPDFKKQVLRAIARKEGGAEPTSPGDVANRAAPEK